MKNNYSDLINKKKLKEEDLYSSPFAEIFNNIKSELGISKPRQILYHAITNTEVIPKCNCGKNLIWHDDFRRYRIYCSRACTAKYSVMLKKEKYKEALGVEWHSQTLEWQDKVKNTSLEKFGKTHYSKTEEYKQRTIATNQIKFNANYSAQSSEIQYKIKQTCLDRYGVDNASKLKVTTEKARSTCEIKYGVDNPARFHYSEEATNFLSDPLIFSAECQTHSVRYLAKKYNISVNPIYSTINKLGLVIPKRNFSEFEHHVYSFITSIYNQTIIRSDRTILTNSELDILLPESNIAFECNGTYWHAEAQGRNKYYHLNKTIKCRDQGIALFHIWEHDWNLKSNIVKSMIANKLHTILSKIYARSTKIQEVSSTDSNLFLDANHLQGRTYQKSINIGLYYHNELVSIMTFSKSRFNNKFEWELLRFANKVNFVVVGGASKLFNYFKNQYMPKTIVSFSDRMYSTGNLYEKIGFVYDGVSEPGYQYTKNFVDTFNRQKFQKHKLKNLLPVFDANLSENDNMKNNGYTRLWDCGNNRYIWQNS